MGLDCVEWRVASGQFLKSTMFKRAASIFWRPSAPPPLWVTLVTSGCMLSAATLLTVFKAPRWSFIVVLALGVLTLFVYGQRAAAALGIRSGDETPRDLLMVVGMIGGVAGVFAASAGRYGGFFFAIYLVLAQVAERVAWAYFRRTDTR